MIYFKLQHTFDAFTNHCFLKRKRGCCKKPVSSSILAAAASYDLMSEQHKYNLCAYFRGEKLNKFPLTHMRCCKVQNYLRAEHQADKFLSRTWIKMYGAGGKEQKTNANFQQRHQLPRITAKNVRNFERVGAHPPILIICVWVCEREKERERIENEFASACV